MEKPFLVRVVADLSAPTFDPWNWPVIVQNEALELVSESRFRGRLWAKAFRGAWAFCGAKAPTWHKSQEVMKEQRQGVWRNSSQAGSEASALFGRALCPSSHIEKAWEQTAVEVENKRKWSGKEQALEWEHHPAHEGGMHAAQEFFNRRLIVLREVAVWPWHLHFYANRYRLEL